MTSCSSEFVFSPSADLFDILLPMLNIYQEFVRNHQYSLQVLANCKQNRDFDKLLKQYESNAACEGRMLETFLTYPMFQVLPSQHQDKGQETFTARCTNVSLQKPNSIY